MIATPSSNPFNSTSSVAAPRVGVARRDGEYRLIALEPIPAATPILEIDGVYVDSPSRYSVQVGPVRHVEPPAAILPDLDIERYRWRFLNHACEPNSLIRGRLLVAVGSIAPWDEITFNYNTTEYEMAEPFICHCGRCDGRLVRGYRFLAPDERQQLGSLVAEHLRAQPTPGTTEIPSGITISA